jgi:tetratricopeptide (TPR) repeat protein
MAVVDSYSPCPCGSGQKYKWCCQKVEAYAERAQRLVDNGQYESAIKPLDEGLAKAPANPWLSTRKALVQVQLKQFDAAKVTLRELHQKHPENLLGSILLTRVVLQTEGPIEAAAQLQQALSARPADQRSDLAPLASLIGSALGQAGFYAAALKQLELAGKLGADELPQSSSLIRSLRMNPAVSPWEKNPHQLSPAPDQAALAFRESFEKALGWANEGLWSSAASAFELLASGSGVGAIADRNRGLCCLWIADHPGAVAALRRYIARSGPSLDAVELECLCQKIEQSEPFDQVEFVHLSWPIRNREGLLTALRGNRSITEGSSRPVNPNDPKSPTVEQFLLLDRPQIEAKSGLKPDEIPLILGEILFGSDAVILETYDDGRLDRLVDRFTAIAGSNIPPAHPRTKIIGKEQRHLLALSWRWQMPEGFPDEEVERLNNEQTAHIVRDIWPEVSNPALRWRTPTRAARAGDSPIALRAAIFQLEESPEAWVDLVDWGAFRAKFNLEPEPLIDPEQVDIDELPLSRLSRIPIDRIDDERLLALYRRAREWGVRGVIGRVARLIDARPALMVKGKIEPTTLYGELALDAAGRSDRAQAKHWLDRGVESEPPLKRSANALAWEMIDLQVQMVLDEPEDWVPTLAMILERYRGNQEATSAVILRLINLGLVQVVQDPSRPDQMALDTRVLEHYLSQYGPRVTTASGQLGVAATRGEIWTPESAAGAAGGGAAIWTPGSATPPAAGESKPSIIVTGH